MRVYEERQKSLKQRMEKLQREMNQPEAQEEKKNAPKNNNPGPNHDQNQSHNQRQNVVQEVIRGVEVVGAELNPHQLASQKETAKYPPGSGTDLAKHLHEQASLHPSLSQFNHN